MREKYGKYFMWAITVMSVMVFGIIFFFFIFRLDEFLGFIGKILNILSPIILGGVIAYMLNPLVVILSRWLTSFFSWCKLSLRVSRVVAKIVAITISLGLLITGVSLLLSLILPELYSSIVKLVGDFRSYADTVYNFINGHLQSNPTVLGYVKEILNAITNFIYDWVNNKLLLQIQTVVTGLTGGIFGVAKLAVNIIVGLIVSVYLLISKDRFIGQIKKLIYTVMKPEKANILLSISRQVDKIFGGFISGKIIDSLIIGVLCFIGVSILRMPYPLLVSVIVGVTNVIPFFGPFIGAIPCAFLILIISPTKCLIFLIFIFALQQLDGNVIGPTILGDSTGLSPFWVVVSILVGGDLFGFAGMLLGVPTFAVFFFLLKTFSEYFLTKKNLPVSSMAYCRVESIDPETKEIVYLKKRKTDRVTQNNHRGLLEALERASNIRQKNMSMDSEKTASDSSQDSRN